MLKPSSLIKKKKPKNFNFNEQTKTFSDTIKEQNQPNSENIKIKSQILRQQLRQKLKDKKNK